MKYTERNPHLEDPADTQRSVGWMRRFVRFLLESVALITCIAAILWLAKCPGDLEWWRPICIGLMLPIIKRLL
jgi:hypothetical protein